MTNKYQPHDFIEWLHKRMRENGWGMREIARQAKLSHPVIIDIFKGEQPSEKTCIMLSLLTGDSVEFVLQLGGYLVPRKIDGNPLHKTLINLSENLSDFAIEEAINHVQFLRERENNLRKQKDVSQKRTSVTGNN